jgi:peptidoglycan hydrolase-like protein with peptidoglycan-binding domain
LTLMRYTLLRTGTAALLLLAVMVQPPLAQAQSVDDCMAARYADALTICKGIIDNGGRNADVYWKLSSAQYQDGQQDQARRTLSEALRLHPGNAKLETLRDIIATDSTEQALIARSAKLNQASLDKGALKITCLTKTGDVGISACQRRLELTDEDGQRMRARLRELEQTRASSQLAVTNEKEPAEPPSRRELPAVPTPPPVATLDTGLDTSPAAIQDTGLGTSLNRPDSGSPDSASTTDAALLAVDARREAYKSTVRDIQARLNELGFDAGFPDGVPGSRTRTALANFYSAIDGSGSSSITDLTLEDLDDETRRLQRADPLLLQSQQAANAGNLAQARQLLAQARQISRLVKVPPPLETALQERPARELPQVALQAPADVPSGVSGGISGGGASASLSGGVSGGVSAIVAPPTIPVTSPPVPRPEPQVERPTVLAGRPTLPAVAPAGLPPSTTRQAASVADGAAAATFSELMGRINQLQGQIRRQEADLAAHLDEIRSAL